MTKKAIDTINYSSDVEMPCNKDLLGLEPYIDSVVAYIEEANDPITISIQGNWGDGKTSFVHNVLNKLDEKIYKSIEINTWQLSVMDDNRIFALSIMSEIIRRLDGDDKTKSLLSTFAYTLLNPLASKLISEKVGTDVNVDLTNFSNIITENDTYQQTDKLKTQFQELVTKTLNKMKTENGDKEDNYRIIFFIDDLDRLHPLIALDLLEKLNNYFKCKGCIFILAIDEEIIKKGVRLKFNTLEEDKNKEKDFFEKIIQVPFNLPVSTYKIDDLIKDILKEKYNDGYGEIITSIYGNKNPRNIKRILNLFKLYSIILTKINNSTNDDINSSSDDQTLRMLLGLLCIQISNKQAYLEIARSNEEDIVANLNKHSPSFTKTLKIIDDKGDEDEAMLKKCLALVESLSNNMGIDTSVQSNKTSKIITNYIKSIINNYNLKEDSKSLLSKGKIYYRDNDLMITIANTDDSVSIILYGKKQSLIKDYSNANPVLDNLYNLIDDINKNNPNITIDNYPVENQDYFKLSNIEKDVNYELIKQIIDTYLKYQYQNVNVAP